ncbi:MAG: CoA ester lyase [Rhodospirillaceae bacterium]|nr:CoA ester lyase [Rhodospirillaceae bacterium]
MSREPMVWRSQLYVPANNSRFIAKAHTRGADAIILDLEDSVPAAERPGARAGLADAVAQVGQSGADVTVRINSPEAEAFADLDAAVLPDVRGIYVTKVRDGAYVQAISAKVSELEAARGIEAGQIRLVAMIETASAYLRAEEIAGADDRIAALVLGGEDIALDLGMVPDADTLAMPKQHLAIVARAAGLVPFGIMGTIADYNDLDAVRSVAERSHRFGFEGAACIHPSVVPVLNAAFQPSDAEVAHARRVVAAYAQAELAGTGAITVDDKMIDVPVVRRAENLLARYGAIQRRGD